MKYIWLLLILNVRNNVTKSTDLFGPNSPFYNLPKLAAISKCYFASKISHAFTTLFLTFSIICSVGFAAEFAPRKANPTEIRIVPVRPTPEADNVKVTLQFPKNEQVMYQQPINVQIRVLGFPVGTMSDFDRKKQVYNDPMGQSIMVFVDDYHPIEIYKSFVDALDPNNLYYDWTLNKDIPFNLDEGMHVIRTFPDRSFGESLKNPGCFAAGIFYVGEQKDDLDVDLNGPYLTYNEPQATIRYTEKKPLLLDFYITNTQLSQDGYKVLINIDNTVKRSLTRWVPYYIYGLKQGTHTFRLQLLDEKNKVVPGFFNDVERQITID